MADKSGKKEVYVIKIGPLLKDVLDRQKDKIKDATYDVTESSYWDAGEIVAKKIGNSI